MIQSLAYLACSDSLQCAGFDDVAAFFFFHPPGRIPAVAPPLALVPLRSVDRVVASYPDTPAFTARPEVEWNTVYCPFNLKGTCLAGNFHPNIQTRRPLIACQPPDIEHLA